MKDAQTELTALGVVLPPCEACGAAAGQHCARDCSEWNAQQGRRYCPGCDAWVKGRECPACGADTMKAAKR